MELFFLMYRKIIALNNIEAILKIIVFSIIFICKIENKICNNDSRIIKKISKI